MMISFNRYLSTTIQSNPEKSIIMKVVSLKNFKNIVVSDGGVAKFCLLTIILAIVGSTMSRAEAVVPVQVATGGGWSTSINDDSNAFGDHSCALMSDQTVTCWGSNLRGQLGNGATRSNIGTTPFEEIKVGKGETPEAFYKVSTVPGLNNVKSIAAGSGFSCALLQDQTVSCWGANDYGQLGDQSITSTLVPVKVSRLSNVAAISAGADYVCALIANGTVECWGRNTWGQLGDSTYNDRLSPTRVSGLSGAKGISTAFKHACAWLEDGTTKCWGDNEFGQLGVTAPLKRPYPGEPLSALKDVKQITSFGYGSCALLKIGTVICWGRGEYGETADSVLNNNGSSKPISNLSEVVEISGGGNAVCALSSDATVRCWGYNIYGQLGNGLTYQFTDKPTLAPELNGTVSLAVQGGKSRHNCAVLRDNNIKCWGAAASGQLNNNSGQLKNSTPSLAEGFVGITAIATGLRHTCFLNSNRQVNCWGDNSSGQLGDSTFSSQLSPRTENILTEVISLAAGSEHSCVVKTSGEVFCWGKNNSGQIGDLTFVDRKTPTKVVGITNAIKVHAAYNTTCVILLDLSLKCWGDIGVFGKSPTNSSAPLLIDQGVSTRVAIGQNRACAVMVDLSWKCWPAENYSGTFSKFSVGGDFACGIGIYDGFICWGNNSRKQLLASELRNAVDVSSGHQHSCYLSSYRNITCWGANSEGQLGYGDFIDSSPRQVPGLSDAVAISAFGNRSCALIRGGVFKCWGDNSYGSIGDGTTTNRPNPRLTDFPQIIKWNQSSLVSVGQWTPLTAESSSGLQVEYTVSNGDCLIAGRLLYLRSTSSCVVEAIQPGNDNFVPAQALLKTFYGQKGKQIISWKQTLSGSVGDKINLDAVASSGLAVLYRGTKGVCTATGSSLSLMSAGTCKVTASQQGNNNFFPAENIAKTFMVLRAEQVITWNQTLTGSSGSEVTLNASASSGLRVKFSAAGGVCKVVGSVLKMSGAGDCTVTASQPGSANYLPATNIEKTFAVNRGVQSISWNQELVGKVGQVVALSARATSGLTISYGGTAGICTVSGHMLRLIGKGVCAVTASQDGNNNYFSATPITKVFQIEKGEQQITWTQILSGRAGDRIDLTASSSSKLKIRYVTTNRTCQVLTYPTLTLWGGGVCEVLATQPGNSNYNPAASIKKYFTVDP